MLDSVWALLHGIPATEERLFLAAKSVIAGSTGGASLLAAQVVPPDPSSTEPSALYMLGGGMMLLVVMELIKLIRDVVKERSGGSVKGIGAEEFKDVVEKAVEKALEEHELKRVMRVQADKLSRIEKRLTGDDR